MDAPSVRFIEGPPPSGARIQWGPTRDELRGNPGVWAEIKRFSDMKSAQGAGQALVRRSPDIKTVVRTVDGQVVLYACAEGGAA